MRIEIRNNHIVLDGYVNAVGRESHMLPSPNGRFIEEIVPKTFERALQKATNVDLLFNHNKDKKLGSTVEGNLKLYEDNIGLRAIATVSDPTVMEKAKKNLLKGWSFGFVANRDQWLTKEDGISKRMVSDLDLLEVSILDTQPAYIATSIEQRGEDFIVTEQRIEEFTSQISDNSDAQTDPPPTDPPETREVDYSIFENELIILQMRGSTRT